ncbi:MAG: DUF177 domain-containing protein [Deltaproteobacteria bacterium]|nr:DUF177 domain-containing protein [Deltaproteobacteria bacterium]
MKIKIEDITDNGLSVDVSEEGNKIEAIAGGKLDFSIPSPVDAHLEFTKTDGNVYVAGDLKAKIRLNCSRCLKEFEEPLTTSFTDFFVRGSEKEKEKELRQEDLEVNYLTGPELDTDEIILGQLSLEAPMKPLCSPDCKGLCPKCGADLNLSECKCPKDEKTDSRFARLRDFKVK